jgi:hypothetical protein
MRRLLCSVAALACAATTAFAQNQVPGEHEAAVELARIVDSARARGLPVDPIVAKARRASQVHAPPARMLAAVQAVAKRLQSAREALGADSPATDITAGEDALSINGVTPDMLRAVRAAQPSRSIAVPLGVLAQLSASGVPATQAAEIVSRLIRGGVADAKLVSLGRDVNDDVVHGAAAMKALEMRLEPLKPVLARVAPSAAAATLQGASPAIPKGRP